MISLKMETSHQLMTDRFPSYRTPRPVLFLISFLINPLFYWDQTERNKSCCTGLYWSDLWILCFQVVGLGNPGMNGSRHSVGMAVIAALAERLGVSDQWKSDRHVSGEVIVSVYQDTQLVLLRPKLLMNVNGVSVVKAGEWDLSHTWIFKYIFNIHNRNILKWIFYIDEHIFT